MTFVFSPVFLDFFKSMFFQILTLSGPAFIVVRQAAGGGGGGSEAQMPKIKVNINRLK